ncbi:MAG: glycogen synthase GlgA [Thermoguttaceae bacterium]
MDILFAASEAVPFAKTGGLADVSSSLPTALSRLGHNVYLFVPAYRSVFLSALPIKNLGIELEIPIGEKIVRGSLLETTIPFSNVKVILVQQDEYYDREGIYNVRGEDYQDNCARYVFFSRAVMEAVELLNLDLDIIHSNDWQTGLIPAYMKTMYQDKPRYSGIRSLHTIHNLAYQGIFWHWDMLLTGIDWKYFTFDKMEFYGKLNMLKTGIVFADGISTVSPRYAAEIQTGQFGCNLDSVLRFRSDSLRGILNGVCVDTWSPEIDKYTPRKYDTENVFENKPICKSELQRELGLPQAPEIPLLGVVGRLAHQKGIDLILETAPDWIRNHNLQYCFLGTGDTGIEWWLHELQNQFPHNIAFRSEFSNPLAHRIEAGADMFLMPSRYEPCGLNQMYSQLYGTLPIVHETGGLADTVIDANEENIAAGTANGFSFKDASSHDLNISIWRALQIYSDRPEIWRQLMLNAMNCKWSWDKSAQQYVDFYKEIIERQKIEVRS